MDWNDCYNQKMGAWASMGQDQFNIQFTVFFFYLTMVRLSGQNMTDEKRLDFLRNRQIPFLATRLQFTYKPARRNSKNLRFRIKPT